MKILIVDDHALVRRGLAHVVRESFSEAEVIEADNAEQALRAFNEHAISNFDRLGEFLRAPSSNSPYADNDSLGTRGATWSFLRW